MVGNENILLCRNKLCFYAYSDLSCRTINDTLFSFNGKNFSEPKLLTVNHTLNRIIHGYHISNKDDLILPLEVSLKLNESLFIEGFESKLLRESNLQYGSYLIKSIETTNITDNSLIFPMNKILNYTHISVKTLTAKLNHLDHWTNNPKISISIASTLGIMLIIILIISIAGLIKLSKQKKSDVNIKVPVKLEVTESTSIGKKPYKETKP